MDSNLIYYLKSTLDIRNRLKYLLDGSLNSNIQLFFFMVFVVTAIIMIKNFINMNNQNKKPQTNDNLFEQEPIKSNNTNKTISKADFRKSLYSTLLTWFIYLRSGLIVLLFNNFLLYLPGALLTIIMILVSYMFFKIEGSKIANIIIIIMILVYPHLLSIVTGIWMTGIYPNFV